ncbi:MAG: hypothetical protein JWN52_4486 [Actinomycetia bacterium]|nr:hypothetical protein [Actinomycetes bacterium]
MTELGFPLFDLVSDTTAILMVKRPVVALSPWLTTAIRTAADAGLALQIVTPTTARLTMPMYSVLTEPHVRWVAGHSDGFYDGSTGVILHFDGTGFSTTLDSDGRPELAELFGAAERGTGTRFTIDFRVLQPPVQSTVLGLATELVYEAFTGRLPSGWGTSEPAALTWRPREITRLCHDRVPTWFCHTGLGQRPAIGTTRVTRTDTGIEEQVTIHMGYGSEEDLPLTTLSKAVSDLAAEHDLIEAVVHASPGRPDLTVAPAFTGLPLPIGIALGKEAVRQIGHDRAFTTPGVTTKAIGNRRNPAAWYTVGDGDTPEAWSVLAELMRRIQPGGTFDPAQDS